MLAISKHRRPQLRPVMTRVLGLSLVLTACNTHPVKTTSTESHANRSEPIPLANNRSVDILFVIDNSSSMGEEQGLLAANFTQLIDVLEHEDVRADYRIAVTTTDRAHDGCHNSPGLGGQLRLESCLDREEDFTDVTQEYSRYNTACAAHCNYDSEALTTKPTALPGSDTTRSRPWIESQGGATNLPDDIDTREAFACLGPQGINGCGYESQLESMYRAIHGSFDEKSEHYGFLREDAMLAIVFVTDEADCSFDRASEAFKAAFEGEDRSLWTNPDERVPGSGLCWQAGVHCRGLEGKRYTECVSAQFAADGRRLDDEDDNAVLHPLARYTDLVDRLRAMKLERYPQRDEPVVVALIAGVDTEGKAVYEASGDTHESEFGIGAGCVSEVDVLEERDPNNPKETVRAHVDHAKAVPPVRLRAFAESYTAPGAEQAMYSVCNDDYRAALSGIANSITQQLAPACFPGCALDMEPGSEDLQPDCDVIRSFTGDKPNELLLECAHEMKTVDGREQKFYLRDESGAHTMPNDEVELCYALRTRYGQEESSADDIDQRCIEAGSNVEFFVERRPGYSAQPDEALSAQCVLSPHPEFECGGFE